MALSYLQAVTSTTDLTTYTFSAANLGAAHPERYIIVSIHSRKTGSITTINTVTIGGVSATIYQQNKTGTNTSMCGLAIALVPTGTTGDVVITFGAGMARCAVGMWRATGLLSPTPYHQASDVSDDPTTTLNVPAKGFAIGAGTCASAAGTTAAWTGLTEQFDTSLETFMNYTGAHKQYDTAASGVAVAIDFGAPTGGESCALFLSWECEVSATRFYLPSTGAAAISPTYNAGWENTSIAARLRTSMNKIASAATTVTYDDADATNQDILFRQYVSDPLTSQDIAVQSVVNLIRCSETDLSNNLFTKLDIRVVSNDGSIVRGTLVNMRIDGVEAATSLTNRNNTGNCAAVTCFQGDRLVIEIGMSGDPAATFSHDSSMSIGDDNATDLGANDTDTTALNPYVEFTNAVTFIAGNFIPIHNVTSNDSSGVDPRTIAHVVPAGLSNTGIVALIGTYDAVAANAQVSTVKWNTTESFTKLAEVQGPAGANTWASAWLLLNPTAGSLNVVVDYVGNPDVAWIDLITVSNTLQTGQPDASDTDQTNTAATATLSMTNSDNKSLVFAMATTAVAAVTTISRGIFVVPLISSGFQVGATFEQHIAGTTALTYTSGSASEVWAAVMISLTRYTASASQIKTINGLVVASVKTVNGLAIASVKKFMGITNV